LNLIAMKILFKTSIISTVGKLSFNDRIDVRLAEKRKKSLMKKPKTMLRSEKNRLKIHLKKKNSKYPQNIWRVIQLMSV
jgi:hypothetical protein